MALTNLVKKSLTNKVNLRAFWAKDNKVNHNKGTYVKINVEIVAIRQLLAAHNSVNANIVKS